MKPFPVKHLKVSGTSLLKSTHSVVVPDIQALLFAMDLEVLLISAVLSQLCPLMFSFICCSFILSGSVFIAVLNPTVSHVRGELIATRDGK